MLYEIETDDLLQFVSSFKNTAALSQLGNDSLHKLYQVRE